VVVKRDVAKWTWRIAANVFYLLVVWYVLNQLRGGPEKIIVPILGLIYVRIRSIECGNAYIGLQLALVLNDMDSKLNKLIDPEYQQDMEELRENRRVMGSVQARSYLDLAGLGLISLLCLWFLLNAI
jgi:hypothetical protein